MDAKIFRSFGQQTLSHNFNLLVIIYQPCGFCYFLVVFIKECDRAIACNYSVRHKLAMNALKSGSIRWTGKAEHPALNHKFYFEYLDEHVRKCPQRNARIVYGGEFVGKSTIIIKKIKEWRDDGQVVVDIDLNGQSMNSDDLLNYFIKEYVSGCEKVNKITRFSDILKNKISKSKRISKSVNFVWTKFIGALEALPFSTQLLTDDSMNKFESAKFRAVLVNALVDSFKNEVLSRKFRDKFSRFFML